MKEVFYIYLVLKLANSEGCEYACHVMKSIPILERPFDHDSTSDMAMRSRQR